LAEKLSNQQSKNDYVNFAWSVLESNIPSELEAFVVSDLFTTCVRIQDELICSAASRMTIPGTTALFSTWQAFHWRCISPLMMDLKNRLLNMVFEDYDDTSDTRKLSTYKNQLELLKKKKTISTRIIIERVAPIAITTIRRHHRRDVLRMFYATWARHSQSQALNRERHLRRKKMNNHRKKFEYFGKWRMMVLKLQMEKISTKEKAKSVRANAMKNNFLQIVVNNNDLRDRIGEMRTNYKEDLKMAEQGSGTKLDFLRKDLENVRKRYKECTGMFYPLKLFGSYEMTFNERLKQCKDPLQLAKEVSNMLKTSSMEIMIKNWVNYQLLRCSKRERTPVSLITNLTIDFRDGLLFMYLLKALYKNDKQDFSGFDPKKFTTLLPMERQNLIWNYCDLCGVANLKLCIDLPEIPKGFGDLNFCFLGFLLCKDSRLFVTDEHIDAGLRLIQSAIQRCGLLSTASHKQLKANERDIKSMQLWIVQTGKKIEMHERIHMATLKLFNRITQRCSELLASRAQEEPQQIQDEWANGQRQKWIQLGGLQELLQKKLEPVREVIMKQYRELSEVYRYYAGQGGSDHLSLSKLEMNRLLTDSKLTLKRRQVDKILTSIFNRKMNDCNQTIDVDLEELTEKDFAEFLVLLAAFKKPTDPDVALEKIISQILENCAVNATNIRRFITKPKMQRIWRTYKVVISSIFRYYAAAKDNTQMNLTDFKQFCKDAELVSGAVTTYRLKTIFERTQQVFGLKGVNESAEMMELQEFWEALFVLTYYKINDPYIPLHTRFEQMIKYKVIQPIKAKVMVDGI